VLMHIKLLHLLCLLYGVAQFTQSLVGGQALCFLAFVTPMML
jgi:hypothetical protein